MVGQSFSPSMASSTMDIPGGEYFSTLHFVELMRQYRVAKCEGSGHMLIFRRELRVRARSQQPCQTSHIPLPCDYEVDSVLLKMSRLPVIGIWGTKSP
jgi:hypothetical protein